MEEVVAAADEVRVAEKGVALDFGLLVFGDGVAFAGGESARAEDVGVVCRTVGASNFRATVIDEEGSSLEAFDDALARAVRLGGDEIALAEQGFHVAVNDNDV